MRTEEEYDEFAKRMEEKYPEMFAQPYGGFCVDKGWWPIVEALCEQIHHHIKFKNEQRDRWNRGDGCEQVVVMQIKEKFGGLRFYYDGGDDAIAGMVRIAEAWADHTCETCGSPGTSGGKGWIKTLCPTHRAEADARYAERFKE
jgi:hypothetical protein